MKKIVLLLLLVLAFGISLFSQDKKRGLNPWGGLNGVQVSMSVVNHFETDASYILTSRPQPDPRCCDFGVFYGFQSISAGINYANINNKSFIGPKVYYQMTFVILAGQVGFDYLTDFNNTGQFRFSPKVGLSFFGYASILYGRNYGIGGTATETGLTNKGTLNLQLQLPFELN
jgi:hypothetical protein